MASPPPFVSATDLQDASASLLSSPAQPHMELPDDENTRGQEINDYLRDFTTDQETDPEEVADTPADETEADGLTDLNGPASVSVASLSQGLGLTSQSTIEVDWSVLEDFGKTDQSVTPEKPAQKARSVTPSTRKKLTGRSRSQVAGKKTRKQRLTGQSFDPQKWKRSVEKPGFLIRRVPGYNLDEEKWGVKYQGVISRRNRAKGIPAKVTMTDSATFKYAGCYNWEDLIAAGLFKPERMDTDE